MNDLVHFAITDDNQGHLRHSLPVQCAINNTAAVMIAVTIKYLPSLRESGLWQGKGWRLSKYPADL